MHLWERFIAASCAWREPVIVTDHFHNIRQTYSLRKHLPTDLFTSSNHETQLFEASNLIYWINMSFIDLK